MDRSYTTPAAGRPAKGLPRRLGGATVTTVETLPPPSNPLRAGMQTDLAVDPGVLVIFGASGDLARRKLLPGLYNLARNRLLPSPFAVVGIARREFDDDGFRHWMRESVEKHSRHTPIDDAVWNDLARSMVYVQGELDDARAYDKLAERLDALDQEAGSPGARTFYLSVPPDVVKTIVDGLHDAGLTTPRSDAPDVAPRVVVEKPFGTDLESARALNRDLRAKLDESQIFRIDHYLGKETVQNLLVLRFGNTIFEPVWTRDHVAYVEITTAEHIGIEGRGAFFEQTGLMRDIVQNHALQLLCLVAMEPPVSWDADAVRDEKVKVLRALRPIESPTDARAATVRGQYDRGIVRGDEVSGYRDEDGTDPESEVETYVALKMHVDNWRWGNVPFYLRAGKRLKKKVTEIALRFRPLPHPLFSTVPGATETPNALRLRIQPDEGIALRFATKIPGQTTAIREVSMDFEYGTAFGRETPEAYERLLLDAMRGDATLFTRADEVEAQWSFCDPISSAWEQGVPELARYESGSWGPREADALLAESGHRWSEP